MLELTDSLTAGNMLFSFKSLHILLHSAPNFIDLNQPTDNTYSQKGVNHTDLDFRDKW